MTMVPDPVEMRVDPATSNFIFVCGRKGSGKSVLARCFWDTYPYDRICVDPTGDLRRDFKADEEDFTELDAPLPARWPGKADNERSSLVYVPNRLDPTYKDELDRAVGLAFSHGRSLCWIDEVGELTKPQGTPPHMDMALHQGRHRDLSLLMCGPRPINISPLCISQADYVYCFDLPNPKDRDRVADNIGMAPKEFDSYMANLSRHGYVRWDAREQLLDIMPPLDLAEITKRRRRRQPVE